MPLAIISSMLITQMFYFLNCFQLLKETKKSIIFKRP